MSRYILKFMIKLLDMNRIFAALFTLLFASNLFAQADDRPEYTGDNFSLEGALGLFKKSTSLEEFEKMLNEENNHVNNLDLNNDNDIDYIVVNDNQEGETHAIVLSVYLSENEKQDIAVIGIEKTGAESATIQIEGDPDLYPENTIVEPKEDGDAYQNRSQHNIANASMLRDDENFNELNTAVVTNNQSADPGYFKDEQIFVNVWFWPGVRYVYASGYVVWRSPWRWRLYPVWWRPWRPHGFGVFYSRCAPHRIYFHRVPSRRVVVARGIYTPRRSRSTLIIHNNRRSTIIINKSRPSRARGVKVRRVRGRRF
jgi:hypothetical protein